MSRVLIAGGIAAALIAVGPAISQTPAPAPAAPKVQDRLGEPGWHGRDRSAIHTRAEVGAHVRSLFDRVDGNRDGYLTREETAAAKGERRKHFGQRGGRRAGAHFDRRGIFDRLDANRDGSISRAEFEAVPMRDERRVAGRDGKGEAAHGRGMRGMRMGFGALRGRMFELADANRDGRVSLPEATNAAYRHFDSADANRDGRLTRDERRQMHQRMRSERRSS